MELKGEGKDIDGTVYHRRVLSLAPKSGDRIRVMTYNVLADIHVEKYLFPHNAPQDLDKISRMEKIGEEIGRFAPDIICLQELQETEVEKYTKLESLVNFGHVFIARPPYEQPKPFAEGSAIFFDKSKFSLVKAHKLMLKMLPEVYDSEDVFSKEMIKSCVVAITILETKKGLFPEEGSPLRIAALSTHLPFNKNCGHVKLGVVALIMKTLARLKEKFKFSDIFLCGDFNFVPRSGLYNYVVNKRLDLSVDLREFSNQNYAEMILKSKGPEICFVEGDRRYEPYLKEKKPRVSSEFYEILVGIEPIIDEQELIRFVPDQKKNGKKKGSGQKDGGLKVSEDALVELSESLGFGSAYACVRNALIRLLLPDSKLIQYKLDPNEFENDVFFSFYGDSMKLAIDYIFFAKKGKLRPIRVLDVPDYKWLVSQNKTCPFGPFGSDHFSLVVDFELKPSLPEP